MKQIFLFSALLSIMFLIGCSPEEERINDWPNINLLITEIYYNAKGGTENNYEWIELHNTGTATVYLDGWVMDDASGIALTGANIASGSIPPDGTAVLFDAELGKSAFKDKWGSGISLIPVTSWVAEIALNNSTDTIGLWTSFSNYTGDNATHVKTHKNITYDSVAPWPLSTDGVSIYLINASAPAIGESWSLSVSGINGAYTLEVGEIGSPGHVHF